MAKRKEDIEVKSELKEDIKAIFESLESIKKSIDKLNELTEQQVAATLIVAKNTKDKTGFNRG